MVLNIKTYYTSKYPSIFVHLYFEYIYIYVSAYPVQYTLGLFLREGWSSPPRIHESAALKWQGILKLLHENNSSSVASYPHIKLDSSIIRPFRVKTSRFGK